MSKVVGVEGMAQLNAALAKVVTAIQISAADVIREEVEATRRDAQSFAPVKTGELRGDIVGKASAKEGEVYSSGDYAVFHEGGTTKMKATPHIAPAAEISRSRFPARAAAKIGKAVSIGGK